MAVRGAFFSHPAALYAQQGGEPAAKTQWQQKENYLKKKKKKDKREKSSESSKMDCLHGGEVLQ